MTATMTTAISPPFLDDVARLDTALASDGYAVLDAQGFAAASGCGLAACQALAPFWNDLPPDQHLKDGGHYRRRRHSCFRVEGSQVVQVPHRAHWQPLEYNALYGGMQRWFEPMQPAMVASPVWPQLLRWLANVASQRLGAQAWFVEAHPFRIDTTDGIGRPTPEGAHRDGVDFVAVFLVGRHGIKGGETRVFNANGPAGQRFTLTEPWSLLLLEDARVIHESTPIQPVPGDATAGPGYRDTLVITLRRGGFQGG
jgi:hypothetical protein